MGARSWNDDFFQGVPVGTEINPFREDLPARRLRIDKIRVAGILFFLTMIAFSGYKSWFTTATPVSAEKWETLFSFFVIAFPFYLFSPPVRRRRRR